MISQEILDNGVFTVKYIANGSNSITVFCPGLTWSKAGPYFLLSKIAIKLYNQNKNSVIFDYYGQGDSSGTYQDVCFDSIYASLDILLCNLTSGGYTQINLVGMGIGNLLASLVMDRPEVVAVVFIDYDIEIYKNMKEYSQVAHLYITDCGYIIDEIDTSVKGRLLRALVGITPWYRGYPINPEIFNISSYVDINDRLINKPIFHVTKSMLHNWGNCLDSLYWKDWVNCREWPEAVDKLVEAVSDWIIKQQQDSFAKLKVRGIINSNTKLRAFEIDGAQVILHFPEAERPESCVIYEPGIGGDRVDHMRCGVMLSRIAQRHGFLSLRYDFGGTGISRGNFYEYSWSERIREFNRIKEYILKAYNLENIYIVSFSEGAKIVSWLSQNDKDIKGAVMWSPILTSEIVNYNEPVRDKHILPRFMKRPQYSEMVLPVQGYYLGLSYFEDHKQYDFYTCMENSKIPLKIIYGENDPFYEKSYFSKFESPDYQIEEIKEDGHLFNYMNMQFVIEKTINYLRTLNCNE